MPDTDGAILDWYGALQKRYGLAPFVRFDKPVHHVSQVHYKAGDADIFFISNYHLEKDHTFTATFNVKGKTAWIWDPETGAKFRYPFQGEKNILSFNLDPAQSILLVFTQEKRGELYPVRGNLSGPSQPLGGPWSVTLEKVYEKPRTITFDALRDFKDDPELKSFAGVVHYEKRFHINPVKAFRYLDLGKVCGISEVMLNGHSLGIKWYGRHIYRLDKELQAGDNTLTIKLTTVLGNYARSLKGNVVAQQWIIKQPLYSMGLLGPVRLI